MTRLASYSLATLLLASLCATQTRMRVAVVQKVLVPDPPCTPCHKICWQHATEDAAPLPARRARHVPVELYSGGVRVRAVDLHVPGRSNGPRSAADFVWARTYYSRADFDEGHGANWDFNYGRRVCPLSGGHVSVLNGYGREDVYVSLGGGKFRSPRGFFDTLVRDVSGFYAQTEPSGTRFDYAPNGRLVRITDRAGNRLQIARDFQGRITHVMDAQDRIYRIAYTTGTPSRIASVTDFANRQVQYTYDAVGNLIRVRSPVVTGTPNGNDFPNGKTTLYTYTSGFTDSRLNHNLVSIIDPQYNSGNDPSKSKAWLTCNFKATLDPLDDAFDRVTSVRWGHDSGGPPSNPNLRVGGSTVLSYSRDLASDPDVPRGGYLRTRETDPNGNVCVHYLSFQGFELKRTDFTNRNVRPGEGNHTTSYSYDAEGRLVSRTLPRGNSVRYVYDSRNPRRESRGNLLEVRRISKDSKDGADLVTRCLYEPVFNRLRAVTDPRGFPSGRVPLDSNGHLDLSDPTVARFTSMYVYDYQEGTGFQAARGIPTAERIAEGLGDQNGALDFDEGNRVKTVHPKIQTAGPNLGDASTEQWTYNAFGQPLSHVDPLGHVTAYAYYPKTGQVNDPADREGYLQSRTVDALLLKLRTTYEYDTVGNRTAVIDPRSQRTDYSVNALNQTVRALSRAAVPTRYRTDYFYDANDELVQTQRLNLDEAGKPYRHGTITDTYAYDILHRRVHRSLDKTRNDGSQSGAVRTEYFYDRNMNRTAVREPRGANQAITTSLYDERDLVFRVVRGDNDTDASNAPPASGVIHSYNYDANGNLVEHIDKLRDAKSPRAPRTQFPGSGTGDVTKYEYDGFDRLRRSLDAEGNERLTTYDRASNRVRESVTGNVDESSSSAFKLLRQVDRLYDELDRAVRSDVRHFDIVSGGNIGDGVQRTLFKYDLDSKLILVTDDRGLSTTTSWDSADRISQRVDQLRNDVTYTYDANGNVVQTTRRDVSSDFNSATDTYVTRYSYDALDRLRKTVDSAGGVQEFSYDSRGNRVVTVDAVRETHPTGPGNAVRYDYDALDRLVATQRELTQSGRGGSPRAGQVLTEQTWDDNSMVVARIDDGKKRTAYTYDNLNRLTQTLHQDNSTTRYGYDVDSRILARVDPNLSFARFAYDGLNRRLSVTVTRGTGVGGSTFERYGYDGLGRVTLAENNDGFSTGTYKVQLRHDSLSHTTSSSHGGIAIDYQYDAVGNLVKLTMPGDFKAGRRALSYTYDGLNRMRAIRDPAGTIATLHYKGPSRLERRTYGTDSTPLATTAYRYDALPRLVQLAHMPASGPPIAEFIYGHNRRHQRLFERRVHEGNRGEVHSYASTHELRRALQNVDLSRVNPGQLIRPENFTSGNRHEFDYDGVRNRKAKRQFVNNVSTPTIYTTGLRNEYSRFQVGNQSPSILRYDRNGNLTSGLLKGYRYDFRDRLVEVRDQKGQLARYSYDALGRRYQKVTPLGTTVYLNVVVRGWDMQNKCVEERDATGTVVRQHVWGNGCLLQQKYGTSTAVQTVYAYENAMRTVAALTDSAGKVVERYAYDPFGVQTITLNGNTGNEYGFQGLRRDPETGFNPTGNRSYFAVLGRCLQRGPGGDWLATENLGNGYARGGNDPVNEPVADKGQTWSRIALSPASYQENILDYVDIEYGGGGAQSGSYDGQLRSSTRLDGFEVAPNEIWCHGDVGLTLISGSGAHHRYGSTPAPGQKSGGGQGPGAGAGSFGTLNSGGQSMMSEMVHMNMQFLALQNAVQMESRGHSHLRKSYDLNPNDLSVTVAFGCAYNGQIGDSKRGSDEFVKMAPDGIAISAEMTMNLYSLGGPKETGPFSDPNAARMIPKKFAFANIDEIDSVLLDQALTDYIQANGTQTKPTLRKIDLRYQMRATRFAREMSDSSDRPVMSGPIVDDITLTYSTGWQVLEWR